MRLHRFYVPTPIVADTFDITDRDMVHQWKKVFRYNVGSQVILFDGSGTDYLCMISSIRNLGATVGVISKKTQPSLEATAGKKNIWLCMALIKKDNFDLVVQKATELGVNHIVPIICEHSEKRKLNLDRMGKIAIEAAEQSGRGDILDIHESMPLAEVLESGILSQEKIALHPSGISFRQYKQTLEQASVAVFVGPEGGFSDKEIALFKQYNMPIVSLGTQILRAETAAVAISSLMLLG